MTVIGIESIVSAFTNGILAQVKPNESLKEPSGSLCVNKTQDNETKSFQRIFFLTLKSFLRMKLSIKEKSYVAESICDRHYSTTYIQGSVHPIIYL